MDNTLPITNEMKALFHSRTDAAADNYKAWMAGCQSMTQSVFAIGQARLENSVSSWKALTAAASPQEALGIQSELTCRSFQQGMADMARLTNESMQIFGKMVAPLKNAHTEGLEKTPFLGG